MIQTLIFVVASFPSMISMFDADKGVFAWHQDIISYESRNDQQCMSFVSTCHLFEESWNELPQPLFWQKIMALSPDSCIVNVASNRKIIKTIAYKDWERNTPEQKNTFRDSLKLAHGLAPDDQIFFTSGKNHFYRFGAVIPQITLGVDVFAGNFVDPWYAQAILLIESPGQLAKSTAGAYGPFQLMPGVARNMGLTVNKYADERSDFDKSAWAASQLLKRICIPEAQRILDARSISYNQTDLWFRLFVMHIYHAGAGNVAKVVEAINPTSGGQELITAMWQTKAGGFGNASQNYSQVVLAALLTLDGILQSSEELAVFK